MPRQYKRKRLAEYWSLDIRPTKIKKNLNSSERWRAKKEAVSGYNDHLDAQCDAYSRRKSDIEDIREFYYREDENVTYLFLDTLRNIVPELFKVSEQLGFNNGKWSYGKGVYLLPHIMRGWGMLKQIEDINKLNEEELTELTLKLKFPGTRET